MTLRRRVWPIEDIDGNVLLSRPELTPDLETAGMAAALAGGGAGNVNNGAHSYLVTFVTAEGETSFNDEDLGAVSATVAALGTDGQVALTDIPLGSAFVTARKLYRTAANADRNIPANYKLLATISNNTATTYTDNIADSSLTTVIPIRNTTENPILSYDASTGAVEFAGATPSNGVGASDSYIKTDAGAQSLLAAAPVDRAVVIVVTIDETFAAGSGAATLFDIGETDTTNKFKNDLNTGSAGAILTYGGVLTAGKALLVTVTAATGTGAGGVTVSVLAMPVAA